MSENSLTIFEIYDIIYGMHEICYRFIDNNVYGPIIGYPTPEMVRGSIGKEIIMMKQNDVNTVRNAVINQTGKKVKIRINRGRHKVDVSEGVISETYPSIFLIKLQETKDMPVRTVSYSYTDILTKDVELILC